MVGPIDGARRQAMTSDRIKCLSEAGVLPAQQAGSKTQNRGLSIVRIASTILRFWEAASLYCAGRDFYHHFFCWSFNILLHLAIFSLDSKISKNQNRNRVPDIR